MPHVNGYSIYVAAPSGSEDWTVRVYREIDDSHIGSTERLSLQAGLEAAHALIDVDLDARRRERVA